MEVFYKFSDNDLEKLKEAKKALHTIDCLGIGCERCPLSLGDRCIENRLSDLITDAEREKGV